LQLIPAIDLHEGECVRLYQGDIAQKTVYSSNPVEMAEKWEKYGAKLLHVVDLDGAFAGEPKNTEVIKEISETLKIPVQVGGGVRTEENVEFLFGIGVSRIVIGTSAYNNPDFLLRVASKYPNKIILGIDAKNMMVAVKGWVDVTEVSACDMIKRFENVPLGGIVYTDIARDGTMQGPNTKALLEVASYSPFPIIASGGISSEDDLRNLLHLNVSNIEGAILGKSLYSGAIDLAKAIKNIGDLEASL